ncbi:trafficking protein Mon1-domain-containing protein [Myxozyma melibiosi]|uniref:Vacuolar fusion protein MON1 n=1 Tax=Myxozyma melibiosi TaxID=54550 RepID=A0ABR1F7U1_9ASCO
MAAHSPPQPAVDRQQLAVTAATDPPVVVDEVSLPVVDEYILSQETIEQPLRPISPPLTPRRASLLPPAQLAPDLVGLSKAFPIRLQSRATTALSSFSVPPSAASVASTSTSVSSTATSSALSSTVSTSPASSVSSAPTASIGSSVKSKSKSKTASHQPLPAIVSSVGAPDIKSLLGKILKDHDPFGRPYISTYNNAFIDADIDDDSITVFDGYSVDAESSIADQDDEEGEMERFLSQKKQYFILSFAGKPIFSMHGSDDLISAHMGIIQALVAGFEQPSEESFASDTVPDQIRFFTAGTTTFAVSVEDPLILVAISKLGETEGQLRTQLDALHTQLLSALTKAQIVKVFNGRTNFDLRKLLGGAETFLRALAREMAFGSPAILLNAIECVRLRSSVRERINMALLKGRTSSLLYGLVVADGRLVSVIRPKRHSLHPPDLQVIFSMLFHNNTFHDGREHWIPICLPKFNNRGFLHAYIVFFRPKVALVLISANKDSFYELRKSKEDILENFETEKCFAPIDLAVKLVRYRTADIGVPAIQHFLYKSRGNVQFTMPNFEPHFPDRKSQHELMLLYRRLHAAIHTRHTHLKVLYVSRGNWIALAWATHSFEVYCVASASTSKATLAQGMDSIIAWVKREESRLFISNGAVSGLSFSTKEFFSSLTSMAIYT